MVRASRERLLHAMVRAKSERLLHAMVLTPLSPSDHHILHLIHSQSGGTFFGPRNAYRLAAYAAL
jgi:hypothetical protein